MTHQNSDIETTQEVQCRFVRSLLGRYRWPGLSVSPAGNCCKHFDWSKSKRPEGHNLSGAATSMQKQFNVVWLSFIVSFSFGYLWPVLWQIRLEYVNITWMTNFTLYPRWIWRSPWIAIDHCTVRVFFSFSVATTDNGLSLVLEWQVSFYIQEGSDRIRLTLKVSE